MAKSVPVGASWHAIDAACLALHTNDVDLVRSEEAGTVRPRSAPTTDRTTRGRLPHPVRLCVPGQLACRGDNPCTLDSCGLGGQWGHVPVSGCAGCTAPSDCAVAHTCTVDGCDAGARTHAKAPCDDGEPFTLDLCDPACGACLFVKTAACGG